jgi:hypothetical protein
MNAEQYSKEIAKAYRCELSKQISTHPPGSLFVMSSEALCGLPSRGYLNSGVVFSMLREALAEYKVTVIIYLRRQDSFVESMYSQAIHEGGCLGFDEFARKYAMLGSLDYARILNDLETYFGRNSLIVRSYHAASAKGLIDDFASVIGSDLLTTHFAASGSKNISYSRNALEIARFCNPNLDEINKKKLRRALQHVMPHGSDEPLRYFSEDARNEFLEKYEFSNNEVAFRFFGGNLNNLFPRPSAALRYCPVSSATNAEISMMVLHLLGQDAQQSAVEVKQKLAIQAAKSEALPWQQPNATEAFAAACLALRVLTLQQGYLAYPWATCIDRVSRGLPAGKPSLASQGSQRCRATVCQHIWALRAPRSLQGPVSPICSGAMPPKECSMWMAFASTPFPSIRCAAPRTHLLSPCCRLRSGRCCTAFRGPMPQGSISPLCATGSWIYRHAPMSSWSAAASGTTSRPCTANRCSANLLMRPATPSSRQKQRPMPPPCSAAASPSAHPVLAPIPSASGKPSAMAPSP